MTRRDAMRAGARRLRAAGIEAARLEARLLLAHALGITPEALLRDQELAVQEPAPRFGTQEPGAQTGGYEALLARRASREPLALILGHREFWSMEFAVSPATLIPRPDSETLIEAARRAFAGDGPRRILDLGTGSGCLLLAALREFPDAWGLGIDVVPAAVDLAVRNAAMHELDGRSAFLCSDWAAAVSAGFDLVLANPPYISTGELVSLMPEVSRYEPWRALDGGADGLTAYRAILACLPALLEPSGVAVLELGAGQSEAVSALAIGAGLTTCVREDMAGIPRAIVLQDALPQKNRLAEHDGESSFEVVAGDRRVAAIPGALWSCRSPLLAGGPATVCRPAPTSKD